VLLSVLLLKDPAGEAWQHWAVDVVLWQIGGAMVCGAAVGWLACRCLSWARKRRDAEPASFLTVTIAVAMTTLAGERLLGGDGVLAAFVAGLVLNDGLRNEDIETRHERFNAALGRFFDLPIMILFGAMIPWSAWYAMGWRGLGFVAGILLFRRLPAWLLLGRLMPWTRPFPAAVFAGWFGPIGAAALFYAMEIQARTGLNWVWPAASLAVGASVVVHGVSGTPFTWWFARSCEGLHRGAVWVAGHDEVEAVDGRSD
jgi:NhaP-type Na+/H+ or K+/H+ antiporter